MKIVNDSQVIYARDVSFDPIPDAAVSIGET